jgi:hypothetical protein
MACRGTALLFLLLCSSVTPWCVILFSTNSSPLVHPPVHIPPGPYQSRHSPTGTFSWNADCIFKLDFDFFFKFRFDICRFLATKLSFLAICIRVSLCELFHLSHGYRLDFRALERLSRATRVLVYLALSAFYFLSQNIFIYIQEILYLLFLPYLMPGLVPFVPRTEGTDCFVRNPSLLQVLDQ